MTRTAIVIGFLFIFMVAFANADGERKFYEKCTKCHGSGLSLGKTKSLDEWKSTIKRMKSHGMSIKKREMNDIAEFLAGRSK
jgi:cytochrome c5